MNRPVRLPRALHPGAWWLWALGLATAASRTTDPLLLLLVLAVAGYVVAARRTDAPWARAYTSFLKLAASVVVLRVVIQALFAGGTGEHLLFRIPLLPLPSWAVGLRVGGPVTAGALASAAYDGLRIGTLIACVGAANALASPTRLLKAVPAALYEAGVALTVAVSLAPQTIVAVARVRRAQRLRGRPAKGIRGLSALLVPVLEGALDNSLQLAAAMDSRGYGRRAAIRSRRRLTMTCTLVGLLAICAGSYGLLESGAPRLTGVPLLLVGAALATAGLLLAGSNVVRTRYRADPWRTPEWVVAGNGVLAAVAMIVAHAHGVNLDAQQHPLSTPDLPVLPTIGVLAALLPAWAAPLPRMRAAPRPMQATS